MRVYVVTCFAPLVLGACTPFAEEPTTADASTAADALPSTDGGAGDGPRTPSACPPTMRPLGGFATLVGKVNVYTTDGAGPGALNGWAPDPDCTSGANVFDLGYCRKFWPSTKVVIGPTPADSTLKPFLTAGCGTAPPTTGRQQFVCCGE